jgi:Protein of unknown function (DUF429)
MRAATLASPAAAAPPTFPVWAGIDFSCNPSRRKPVTVALGRLRDSTLTLDSMQEHRTLDELSRWLATPGPWLGAFDFPFGLPRVFVEAHALGSTSDEVIQAVRARCATRMAWRRFIDEWGNARPAGERLVHRRTDLSLGAVRSTSPLQTRYVPVGFMYYEGMARLVDAGLTIAQMRVGDPARVAIEGYPGLLAHDLIGRRSYKNRDEPDRLAARGDIVAALREGSGRLALRVSITAEQEARVIEDVSGDRLDALLCLVQAAWASTRPGYGLPADFDALEGWIATAAHQAEAA